MRKITTLALALIGIAGLTLCLAGCGGGLDDNTGAAEGYLYVPRQGTTAVQGYVFEPTSGTGDPIVGESVTPPAGYEAVSGALVSVADGGRVSVATDWSGYFVISGLPAGTYEVTITVPGKAPFTISLVSSPTVVIISGSPNPPPGFVAGPFVILVFEGGISTLTDPNGYFYGGDLPTGLVIVTITTPGYPPFTMQVFIEDGVVHSAGFGAAGS